MNMKGRKAKMAAGLTAGAMLLGLTGPMAIAETVKGDVNSDAKANTAWNGEDYGMKAQPNTDVNAKGGAEAKNDGMKGYGMKAQPNTDVNAKGDAEAKNDGMNEDYGMKAQSGSDVQAKDSVDAGDMTGLRTDGQASTKAQNQADVYSPGTGLVTEKGIPVANQIGKDVPDTGLVPKEDVLDNPTASYVFNLVKQVTGIVDHTPNNGSTPNPL